MRSRSQAKLLFAAVLALAIVASAAKASEQIPGPPLESSGAAARSFCTSREGPGPADAAGFGLAALGAALLLRRSSRQRSLGSPGRDAD